MHTHRTISRRSTDLSSFPFDRLQFPPFLDRLGQIDLTQRHLHLADLVVLGEPVEVEYGEHQGLVHRVRVRYPLRNWRWRNRQIIIYDNENNDEACGRDGCGKRVVVRRQTTTTTTTPSGPGTSGDSYKVPGKSYKVPRRWQGDWKTRFFRREKRTNDAMSRYDPVLVLDSHRPRSKDVRFF